MKLTDCPLHTPLRIVRVPIRRMEELGFVPGTVVSLTEKKTGFPLIVRMPDGFYLIDRKTAEKTEVALW